MIMVAAVDFAGVGAGLGQFDRWSPPEFAAPNDERVLEHAALLQVLQQGANGLI